MSETEQHIGKLIPLGIPGSVEEASRALLKEEGIAPDDLYESFIEQLSEELYDKYVVLPDGIYTKVEKHSDPYSDIMEMDRNEDGSLKYTVKYYNGGCCFSEAIETAFKRMNDD